MLIENRRLQTWIFLSLRFIFLFLSLSLFFLVTFIGGLRFFLRVSFASFGIFSFLAFDVHSFFFFDNILFLIHPVTFLSLDGGMGVTGMDWLVSSGKGLLVSVLEVFFGEVFFEVSDDGFNIT